LKTAARERHTRLVRSALDHLTTAKDEPDFRKHTAFVLQNPSLILDFVPTLRQAIFSLAVQGHLLPQNAKKDGTAEQAINERRSRLKTNVASRKKSRLEFEAIDDGSIPLPVPRNWKWIRFGELADRLEYGTSEKSFANAKGVPTLRMGNVQDGKLDLANLKYVPYECTDLPKLFLEDGDIIFNRTNSAELVGKAAVFRGKPKSFTLASYLIRVSLDEIIASPDFFNLAINSSYYRRTQIEPELTQQCGQANFSGSKLANSIVPLPPIAEQQRIVAKVDELMRWCDALEARLTAAETTAINRLLMSRCISNS
jgi:type I restriction enzyme S subunit